MGLRPGRNSSAGPFARRGRGTANAPRRKLSVGPDPLFARPTARLATVRARLPGVPAPFAYDPQAETRRNDACRLRCIHRTHGG